MVDSTGALKAEAAAEPTPVPRREAHRPAQSFAAFLDWLEEYWALFGPPPLERARILLTHALL